MPKRPSARLYRGTPRNLARLALALRRGELVAVPTETVYGLAANALNADACRQVFHAKNRPAHDPLIVHIHALAELKAIAVVNEAAQRLARRFWPGPLTMILPKTAAVPGVVTAGRPSIAVRMPAHPLMRRLLRLARVPLAAPSANPFGYVSPTTAEHVRSGLGTRIRHILDGGAAPIGLESTIVDLRDPRQPRLLRPGAITRQQLQVALGRAVAPSPAARNADTPVAPGMLKRHYSPRTPLVLHDRLPTRRRADDAWVFLARPAGPNPGNIFWLDPRGESRGAARRLFAVLRELDRGGWRRIHVARAHGGGLADAINDRLARAAAR